MDRPKVAEVRTRVKAVRKGTEGSWQKDLSASARKTILLLCDDADALLTEIDSSPPVPLRSTAQ